MADRCTLTAVGRVSVAELFDWRTKVAVVDVLLSMLLWQAVVRARK